MHREHDAERDDEDTDHQRDPAHAEAHQVVTSASACSSSSGRTTSGRGTTRRVRAGVRASAVPSSMMRPPIHSHITSVPTCTTIVTRPDVGADTSVRYQSWIGPVLIDGVPIPSAKL